MRLPLHEPCSSDAVHALLERVHLGDEAALGQLLKRCEPEIRRIVRVRLGPLLRSHMDSMDLVQSLYVTLIDGFRHGGLEIRSPEQLVAYGAGIIRRKIIQHFRKEQRHEEIHRRGATQEINDRAQANTESFGEPDRAAEYRDRLQHVMEALSAADRELVQHRMDGMTTVEAARAMGVDATVLRARLARLRKHLSGAGTIADLL